MAIGRIGISVDLRRSKVAKPDWGTKRTCRDCGARFFDLKRDPAPCPQCGAELTIKVAAKRARAVPPPKSEPPEATEAETPSGADEDGADADDGNAVAATGDGAIEEDNDEEDLIEDTSDLGEDDDDMAEAREHIDEKVTDKG